MRGLERFAPLTGLLFVVLVIVSTIVVGETPSADDGAAKAVGYWADNKDEVIAGSIIAAISTVVMLWFAGVWRATLAASEGPGSRLATTAFGGLVVAAIGWSALFTLRVHGRRHLGRRARRRSPGPCRSCRRTSSSRSRWASRCSCSPAGWRWCAVRHSRTGPVGSRWCWGCVCLTPGGFFGVLGGLAWILGISIMLFLRGADDAGPPAAHPLGRPIDQPDAASGPDLLALVQPVLTA